MSIDTKLEQIRVALDNLAALVPPTHVYDEEGNDITDPALITAYEEAYAALRLSIITAAGPDFSIGISLTGYDPTTISQVALVACLTTTLQIGHTLKWYYDIA